MWAGLIARGTYILSSPLTLCPQPRSTARTWRPRANTSSSLSRRDRPRRRRGRKGLSRVTQRHKHVGI
eukprot:scaffold662626_cov36-Prasinocladus_malaysianus.AAC.1